jgi:hypothetical protein
MLQLAQRPQPESIMRRRINGLLAEDETPLHDRPVKRQP